MLVHVNFETNGVYAQNPIDDDLCHRFMEARKSVEETGEIAGRAAEAHRNAIMASVALRLEIEQRGIDTSLLDKAVYPQIPIAEAI